MRALTPAPVGQSQEASSWHRAGDSVLANVKVRGLEIHPEVDETRNERNTTSALRTNQENRRSRNTLLWRTDRTVGTQ